MARTVLVTGATGAIGSRLLQALGTAGWTTRCLVHRRLPAGCDETAHGDLTDRRSLSKAAAGVDAILHLGALTHSRNPRRYDDVNARGTANLVEAARERGVRRFVYVSTRAIDERGGAYSRSKLAGEASVLESGLVQTILRPAEVYGAGGSEGIERIIDRAQTGGTIPIVGSGKQEVCPVHVDDLVPALVAALAADAAAGKTYTLGGECLTVDGLVQTCRQVFGRESRVVRVPRAAIAVLGALSRFLPLPIYPDQLVRLEAPKPPPSPEATTDLGFNARDLETGLRQLHGVSAS